MWHGVIERLLSTGILFVQERPQPGASVGQPSAEGNGRTIDLSGGVALRDSVEIDERDCRSLFGRQLRDCGSDNINGIRLGRHDDTGIVGQELGDRARAG
jgi:hypothetical protein